MTAQETIAAAILNDGCLGKSADDEPVFVLCGRDPNAADLVRAWADLVENKAALSGELTGHLKEKITDARKDAIAMDKWRSNGYGKQPD